MAFYWRENFIVEVLPIENINGASFLGFPQERIPFASVKMIIYLFCL